jgi:hypothetical protein
MEQDSEDRMAKGLAASKASMISLEVPKAVSKEALLSAIYLKSSRECSAAGEDKRVVHLEAGKELK